MSETRQELLDRASAILSDRRAIYEQMRDGERERGYRVVLPGEERWLSADDWHESVVVSLDETMAEVRIVAVLAKRPGSFKRLCASLASHGLLPVVVCPIGPIMPAMMRRYGWVHRQIGSGWEAEEEWRPPVNGTPQARTERVTDTGEQP